MSPARVNEHNPCHPDELRLEEDPIRTTRRTTDGIVPPVSWVPGGGVLRRGTPIQNRGEERREREGGRRGGQFSLCTRESTVCQGTARNNRWMEMVAEGEEAESRASKNNRLANKGSTAITNLSTRASNSFRTRFRSPGWGEKSLTRCT